MAWTAPMTWTASVVSVANMNTHVRDNLNAINSTPKAHVTRAALQIITSGVTTAISWDTQREDTDTIWTVSPNPTRLTCQTAGSYIIGCSVEWEAVASAASFHQLQLVVNGTTTISDDTRPPTSGGFCRQVIVAQWQLAATNYVEVYVGHDRGSALSITKAGSYSPEFWMQRLSD